MYIQPDDEFILAGHVMAAEPPSCVLRQGERARASPQMMRLVSIEDTIELLKKDGACHFGKVP